MKSSAKVLKIEKSKVISDKQIVISGSKSETNRLLLLQALYPEIAIENPSDSDDSTVMRQALRSAHHIIDVGHAGTAMRFLTAFFAMREGISATLTGSKRMKERPIAILVNALRELGADIEYPEKDGYPPLKIRGKKLRGSVEIPADVSSQYITALMLIAGKIDDGLTIELTGTVISTPYIEMTTSLLNSIGISATFKENTAAIEQTLSISPATIAVESDWSSASYHYSLVALSEIGTTVTLRTFSQNSLQGDSRIGSIYRDFGVETDFNNGSITLRKTGRHRNDVDLVLTDNPDLAQTIAVTCLGLQINCKLHGLQSLRIKETDRLTALQNELSKFNARVSIDNDTLSLMPEGLLKNNVIVETYGDHRMAMAFAPISLKVPVTIADADVVSKSYPAFWDDMRALGLKISNLNDHH